VTATSWIVHGTGGNFEALQVSFPYAIKTAEHLAPCYEI